MKSLYFTVVKKDLFFVSDFCHSLKEGKGLLIIKTLIQGEYEDYADQAENFRAAVNKQVKDRKVEAIETGIAVSSNKKNSKLKTRFLNRMISDFS